MNESPTLCPHIGSIRNANLHYFLSVCPITTHHTLEYYLSYYLACRGMHVQYQYVDTGRVEELRARWTRFRTRSARVRLS
jgi:hypothetical protein